ncbi:MAG: hypothetical protein ACRDOB_28330 [Streptosporangiaceae bacterium]
MRSPRGGRRPRARVRGPADRRRRRKRVARTMLSLLTVVTTAVLVIIVLMIRDMAKLPTTAKTTALSSSAAAAPSGTSGPTPDEIVPKRAKASPSPSRSASRPRLTDTASGLSYELLPSPWHRGCPGWLDTPAFSWDAGESALAGQVIVGETQADWHGNACSGQLSQAFAYSGPADLGSVAMVVVDALDPAYYSALPHDRATEGSYGTQVSGHAAWVVKFLMTYPDAASQGLAWSTELGAVVVVDRGAGHEPAVFYVSVPNNLGTANVSTLIGSLRAA